MALIARTVADDVVRLLCRRFGDDLGTKLAATPGIGHSRAYVLATATQCSDESMSAWLRPKVCVALRNSGVFWATIEAIEKTPPVVIDDHAWFLHKRLLFPKEKT